MWRSNLIRMAIHTAADIVEDLTNVPARKVMDRTAGQQSAVPNGKMMRIPSSFTACNFGQQKSPDAWTSNRCLMPCQ